MFGAKSTPVPSKRTRFWLEPSGIWGRITEFSGTNWLARGPGEATAQADEGRDGDGSGVRDDEAACPEIDAADAADAAGTAVDTAR